MRYSNKIPSGSESQFNKTSFFYAFLSVATILLPVHPSLQSILYHSNLPSFYLSILLFSPIPIFFLTRFKLKAWHVFVLTPFFLYVVWFFVRGISSGAVGTQDFEASARSVYVLIPLSLICAIVASYYYQYSSVIIFLFGLVALLHFVSMHMFSLDESGSGFRSLSTMEKDNYQATGFYIGLSGLLAVCFLSSRKFLVSFFSAALLIFVVFVMGLVGARTSTIALLLTTILYLFFLGERKLLSISIVLLFLVVSYISFLFGLLPTSLLEKITVLHRIGILFEGGDSSHRIGLFTQALYMWFDSAENFLIGGGLATYPIFIGADEAGWYPHNFILETLAEGGVVAFLILVWILFLYGKKIFLDKWKDSSFSHSYAAALSLYALISYQFMGGIATVWIPFFYVSYFLFLRVNYGGR